LGATPALADTQPTARDIEAAVDTYLASAQQDATLVGGPGSAGYDSGFWIRGGDFTLRINLTLQARFEYFMRDDNEPTMVVGDNIAEIWPPWHEDVNQREVYPGGDTSGFSLPRALLKFSGTAPCNMRYYVELDFGHSGANIYRPWNPVSNVAAAGTQWMNFSILREAWIEWGMSDAFNVRMGDILYPNTRQMMVAPELQQFVDISMASAVTGWLQPGMTDRNRDYGLMIHGALGCKNEWQYMFAVTNGDGGDDVRNVLNPWTSDNFMFSGRLNWAFLEPIGYTEGATRFNSCTWYGEVGLWGSYYADRMDMPHIAVGDRLMGGLDFALGYGGFSCTGAFTYFKFDNSDIAGGNDEDWLIYLIQIGYLFPDTPWEIAGRFSGYQRTVDMGGHDVEPETYAAGGVINYYLNGHGNKLSLDFSWINAKADQGMGGGYADIFSGVPLGFNSDEASFLFRFQWQLAL
jgi:hypothetical protein